MKRSKRNFHHCVNSQWFWIGRNKKLNNKRRLSADGVSLLPSALRPRLLGVAIFLQIVAMSTIFALPCSTPVLAASITITVPSAPISLDINPSPSGTFLKSDATQIGVKTNAFAGYTLSIRAKDDTNGNNLISGTNKLASITEEDGLSEDAYKANGHNNTWAYQPSKLNSNENANFLPGPTTSPSTIEQTSVANESSDNNYNLTIATKVDSTLASGTYNNTFVLEATANSVPYSIQYELNDGLNGPEPNPQTGNSTENTVNLSSTVPTKDNYEFLGWCDAPTSDENCNGNTYKESSPFPLKNGDNTVTLYAIWKANPNTLQGWNGCSSLSVDGSTALIDARDNSEYTVAKLKDDKCWMTQNLRIVNTTINSVDSDITSGNFIIPASDQSAFNTDSLCGGWTNCLNQDIAYYGDDASYGAWYSWNTATAGSGKNYTNANQNAPDSICPKGWKLPTGGTDPNSDYQQLYRYYRTGAQLTVSPANFVYAGFVAISGALFYQGEYGYYWSSTLSDNITTYVLFLYSSSANPADHNSRPYGSSVRCVKK